MNKTCKICGKEFNNPHSLWSHSINKHGFGQGKNPMEKKGALEKVRKSLTGRHTSPNTEFKKGNTPWWIERGLPHPSTQPEVREKMSKTWFGNLEGIWICPSCGKEFDTVGGLGGHISYQVNGAKDLLEWIEVNGSWNKGLTKETDERVRRNAESVSRTMKEMIEKGELDAGKKLGEYLAKGNPQAFKDYYKYHEVWNKGTARPGPYGYEFTEELKERVRDFYGRRCVSCGVLEGDTGFKLDTHHIDGTKTNNNFDNLIPLCKSCHAKVTNQMCKKVICI